MLQKHSLDGACMCPNMCAKEEGRRCVLVLFQVQRTSMLLIKTGFIRMFFCFCFFSVF